MTSAPFNAAKVYEACQAALKSSGYQNEPLKLDRLAMIADLAIDAKHVGENIVTIDLDDYALLHGHWPTKASPTIAKSRRVD